MHARPSPERLVSVIGDLDLAGLMLVFLLSDNQQPTHLDLAISESISLKLSIVALSVISGALVFILSRMASRHANSGNYGWFPTMQRTVFLKLLCFAIGGAGGVEPLPAKRLSAQHCPCFITPPY